MKYVHISESEGIPETVQEKEKKKKERKELAITDIEVQQMRDTIAQLQQSNK